MEAFIRHRSIHKPWGPPASPGSAGAASGFQPGLPSSEPGFELCCACGLCVTPRGWLQGGLGFGTPQKRVRGAGGTVQSHHRGWGDVTGTAAVLCHGDTGTFGVLSPRDGRELRCRVPRAGDSDVLL